MKKSTGAEKFKFGLGQKTLTFTLLFPRSNCITTVVLYESQRIGGDFYCKWKSLASLSTSYNHLCCILFMYLITCKHSNSHTLHKYLTD